jgi:hypothetical protein
MYACSSVVGFIEDVDGFYLSELGVYFDLFEQVNKEVPKVVLALPHVFRYDK